MAPMTRMPSRPRLMRPLRSVMHSPRLTKRNGVLTRMAPPSTASGTPHHPSEVIGSGARRPEDLQPAVQRLAGEDEDEGHALQHQHGGVGQIETPLQHPAAGRDAANEHRDGHDRDWILAGDERDEDAAVAV